MRTGLSCITILLLLWATGCARPLAKASFEVEVQNNTLVPLSMGLVKSGGPGEDGWTSPSDIAIGAPHFSERKWGTLLPPNQKTVVGPLEGRFNPGSSAVLRVYAGDLTVEELLTYSRGDGDRLDLYLMPGRSAFVIERARDGRLTARQTGGQQ
jgi:hypothetical protein